jgi:hypothetical protein
MVLSAAAPLVLFVLVYLPIFCNVHHYKTKGHGQLKKLGMTQILSGLRDLEAMHKKNLQPAKLRYSGRHTLPLPSFGLAQVFQNHQLTISNVN